MGAATMRRIYLFPILLILAACMDRNHTPVMPAALEIGTIHKVFVATHRMTDDKGWYSAERAPNVGYTEIAVSIPPERRRGDIPLGYKEPDPTKHFAVAARQDLDGRASFRRDLSRHITARPHADREVTVYVHGYNNSFLDGVYRSAQLMHDFDLPGTVVHYSWPSAANPLGYTYDRDSVLFARDGLEQLLRDVKAAGPTRIILVGHSLGTMLMMETMRQIEIGSPGWTKRNLDGAVLISPDLDVELFKTQASRFAALPQPFAIFVSERDKALMLSARINGVSARLGNLTSAGKLGDFPVTLVDVTEFTKEADSSHFTAGTSPTLISLLRQSADLDRAFQRDTAGKTGPIFGTVLTVRNATTLILSPHLVMYATN